ncbi:MAG: CCA tRNA nucleotidyltransferase [Candidatus Aenigmarchaeota archaeon]|nr:CCA tRNA nucleotidyltransferase [Candidatus Aenigmarchaeota archaeon]
MPEYQKVLNKVFKRIKPSSSEEKRLSTLSQKTLQITREKAKKYNAKAILAGSITRNTWLPGKKEFDVFLLFSPDLPESKLEEYGLLVGKEVIKELKGKFSVEYAQHPYASGIVEGIDIDIVPCYEVESAERIKSAVDRTPFHVKYIEKRLQPVLSDEVRLLKQFLTANKLYGADAKTEGFSGYVCEILTIRYGGFLEVLRHASGWKPGEAIDVENHYKNEDLKKLKEKFRNNPLTLIDPTDKNRNTVAALSVENFLKFKKLAKEFLAKPSEKYFAEKRQKPITSRELSQKLQQRKTDLILVKFAPPKVVPDILWPQLNRFSERLQDILEESRYEFKVLRRDAYSDEVKTAVVLLELEIFRLPHVQKRVGPSVFDVVDSARFLEKYKKPLTGPFSEGVNWAVEIKRKFVTAHEKLVDSLSKNAEILKAKGIPNYIADQVSKQVDIISDAKKLSQLVKKDKNFGVFLRNYFEKESLS